MTASAFEMSTQSTLPGTVAGNIADGHVLRDGTEASRSVSWAESTTYKIDCISSLHGHRKTAVLQAKLTIQ